uniref:Uncharacterized protein n=1 Tax=Denticeps clupeoides TaxID=299321 RepID=A0AAY4CER4_9TELE
YCDRNQMRKKYSVRILHNCNSSPIKHTEVSKTECNEQINKLYTTSPSASEIFSIIQSLDKAQ